LLRKEGSVETCFSIGLHNKDLAFLKQIQTYLGGVGNIVKHSEDLYAYRVNSVKDILSHILPHFDKFPLITNKQADYLL
jgi:LAGLIDADG endonuclease